MAAMTRFCSVLLGAALVAAAALWGQPTALAVGTCGGKGQPSCPLQGWMEKNMQVPYDNEDLRGLASALEKVAGMAPDKKWNAGDKGWEKIAKNAAAKAKAGDFKSVKKSCKSCHKAWRKKYKAEHRMRPVPKK